LLRPFFARSSRRDILDLKIKNGRTLNKMESSTLKLNTLYNIKEKPIPDESTIKKYKELKEKGNIAFKEKNYEESIRLFSEAMKLNNLSNNDMAILYCNRSAAYFALGEFKKNYKKSLEDAEIASRLDPNYVKAYYRKGKALEQLGKYEKSIQGMETGR
jgi:tetratricopeptide (TPR) repeat protein